MKIKAILLSLAVSSTLLVGCGTKTPAPAPAPKSTPTPVVVVTPGKTDVVTTASIVDQTNAFEQAISKQGTWIIAILKDLTFNTDLVLEGVFVNGKKDASGKDILERKIALYTQDAKHVVTNRFTLTAPKLTIKSPDARIQSGIFKGDLYVQDKNFQLVDAKVDGNIYFFNDVAKSSFKMDATSSVTGKKELKK